MAATGGRGRFAAAIKICRSALTVSKIAGPFGTAVAMRVARCIFVAGIAPSLNLYTTDTTHIRVESGDRVPRRMYSTEQPIVSSNNRGGRRFYCIAQGID